jgi:hypothetical protein
VKKFIIINTSCFINNEIKIIKKSEYELSLSIPIVPSKNRHQIEFKSLEDCIGKENTIRFIDAFVEDLELGKLAFANNTNCN